MKFKCNYCGTEYERPVDRAMCEIKCDKKAQEKIKEEKQKKLHEEESSRLKAIQKAWDTLVDLIMDFKRDYHKVVYIDTLAGCTDATHLWRWLS